MNPRKSQQKNLILRRRSFMMVLCLLHPLQTRLFLLLTRVLLVEVSKIPRALSQRLCELRSLLMFLLHGIL